MQAWFNSLNYFAETLKLITLVVFSFDIDPHEVICNTWLKRSPRGGPWGHYGNIKWGCPSLSMVYKWDTEDADVVNFLSQGWAAISFFSSKQDAITSVQ